MLLYAQKHADFFIAVDIRHSQAGCVQSFEQRFRFCLADAQHFAGGFHFRSQNGVRVIQLLKREDRHFYSKVRRYFHQTGSESQIFQFCTKHDFCCQIHHRHIRHFADVWHRPGCPRVHFDHIQFVIKNQVLDVDQALCTQCQRQFLRNVADLFLETVIQIIWRINSNGIAAVHTRTFNMFHDARDQHIDAIGDDIDFQFDARHILIDQDRVGNATRQDLLHVGFRLFRSA